MLRTFINLCYKIIRLGNGTSCGFVADATGGLLSIQQRYNYIFLGWQRAQLKTCTRLSSSHCYSGLAMKHSSGQWGTGGCSYRVWDTPPPPTSWKKKKRAVLNKGPSTWALLPPTSGDEAAPFQPRRWSSSDKDGRAKLAGGWVLPLHQPYTASVRTPYYVENKTNKTKRIPIWFCRYGWAKRNSSR